MTKSILSGVLPALTQDRFGVWRKEGAGGFDYSDGTDSEKYLYEAFTKADDLSSDSEELEGMGQDWTSEYHLTRKRAQLLRAYDFDPAARVLEVGSGCGAITRFLGETFNDVVAVEGSRVRARLARLRTKGLDNVTVISSPFQDTHFEQKFDIIFCIGVFEYSAHFVPGNEPYTDVLSHFEKLLTPEGYIVVAIENQLGLKYFSASAEDHTNRMFEGIEDYPRFGGTVRTFGYQEIRAMLAKHFPFQQMYFPYPDYKLPDVVISEDMLERPNAEILVGGFASRDYAKARTPFFDEKLAGRVLAKNGLLPHLANSFLIFAGKRELANCETSPKAVYFSSGRDRASSTITTLVERADGDLWAVKRLRYPQVNQSEGDGTAKVAWRSTESKWRITPSIEELVLRALLNGQTFEQALQKVKIWVDSLERLVTDREALPVWLLDPTWDNSFVENNQVEFVDQEWEATQGLSVNLAVARALYCFYAKVPPVLRQRVNPGRRSGRAWMFETAETLGIKLGDVDISALLEFEVNLYQSVSVRKRRWTKQTMIKLFLLSTRLWEVQQPWGRRLRNLILFKDRLLSRLFRMRGPSRDHDLFIE